MKLLTLLLSICQATSDTPKEKKDYFNILSIDGGGIRGLIPAQVIGRMEKYGYTYAKSKGYAIPEYTDLIDTEVLAMKDLFNMTAGTSTGSIIAAGLVYP